MTLRIVLLSMFLLLSTSCSKTARTVLKGAQNAMGDVSSIEFSGTGVQGFYGQALLAGKEWPRRELTSYTRKVNYTQPSSSDDMVFKDAVFGGRHQNPVVSGNRAWNVTDNGPVAQPAAAELRQLRIWLTPHGFLKAAGSAENATLIDAGGGTHKVTFSHGKYEITGTIDAQNMVSEIETKFPDPVLGDAPLVAVYSHYQDFGGVKFPTTLIESQGGFPILDLAITSVKPNVAFDLPVPADVQKATVRPMLVDTAQIADGVWHLKGGSHHSVLVRFPDFLALIEAPQNEDRSLALITEAKRLVPDQKIRYVVSTHHHFDHSGGLRTFVAEGATIVTHESSKDYFTQTFKAPATIAPDELAKFPKDPVFQTVSEKWVLSKGGQTIEVHAAQGDTHTDELLVAYLPGPGILVEADSYSPPALGAAPPPMPSANAMVLWDNIQRLKLKVKTIAAVHGREAVPFAEFKAFVRK